MLQFCFGYSVSVPTRLWGWFLALPMHPLCISADSRAKISSPFPLYEILKLIEERLSVLEISIDGCKADVSNFIDFP